MDGTGELESFCEMTAGLMFLNRPWAARSGWQQISDAVRHSYTCQVAIFH